MDKDFLERLRDANLSRVARWHVDGGLESWSLPDWYTALHGELGEAGNVIKKLNRDRDGLPGNTNSRDELLCMLGSECADTVIYLDILAAAIEVKLSTAHNAESVMSLIVDQESDWAYGLSEWYLHAVRAFGAIADLVVHRTTGARLIDRHTGADTAAMSGSPYADRVFQDALDAIRMLTVAAGLDLEEAVRQKFNSTSIKNEFPERI